MEVEVVFPDICSAYYKATFQDINISEGKCLVTFEDGWKPNEWIDLQNVRYPPHTNARFDPSPGTQVEAFLPLKEGERAGWWLASINKSKGEIAGIQFQMTADSVYSDLVEHKYLRAPNENPPFSDLKFFTKEFEVPSNRDIHDFCCDPKVHSNFQSKIQALSVTYDPDKQSLIVLADNQRCVEKAELLIEMHLSDLNTQATLKTRTERVALRLQTTSIEDKQPPEPDDNGIHEEKVFIPHDLIGLAMGKQGRNVNIAREIPGIISIDFDDFTSMFTIKAETVEASAQARELIEFMQEIQYIPRDLAGKVIGKQGKIVQQILEKSKLINIKVIGDQEAKDRKLDTHDVPFEFVGRRTAIEDAKMMLDYHLDHLREVSSILKDREEITQKLRDSGIEEPPMFYPRPNNSSRGRGRGRGRQTGGGGQRRNRPGGRYNDREDRHDENEYEEEQQNNNNGDNESGESESTEDEQQRQDESMKRADSPVEGDTPTDRRRKPKNNKRYGNRRKGGPPRNPPPPQPTNNNVDNDWPVDDEEQPRPQEEEQPDPSDDQPTTTTTTTSTTST